MNKTRRVAKNTIVRSAAQVFNMILSAGFLMYVTRKLGSTDFGKYTLAFSLSSLLVVVSEMGVHTLLMREIAKKKDKTNLIFGNILIIKLFLTVLFFLLLAVANYLLNSPREVSYIVYAMGIFVLTTSFFDVINSVFRGYEKMEYEAAFMLLNRVIVVASGAFALYIGYRLKGFATALVISNIMSLFPAVAISFKKFIAPKMKIDADLVKVIFKEAFPIGLMLLLTTVILKSGAVLIPLFKDYTDTGLYGAPLRLMESLIVFPLFFSNALLPVFTALYTSRSESLIRWYEGSFRFLIIIGLPFVIVVTVLANNFVRLLFGKGFADSAIVLQLLIWATFFMSLNTILSYLLIATDRQRLNVITYGIGAVCTVISGLILIPPLSYTGAGISLLSGQILLFAMAFYLIYRTLFKVSLIHLTVKPLISSFLMGGLIFFLKEWNIILGVLFGILFYFGFLFLFRAIHREDMALFKDILRQG